MSRVHNLRVEEEERRVPASVDIEQAVLGAVLLHNEAWLKLAAVCSADDFFRAAHQRIFRAMAKLAEAGSAIDMLTLKVALRASGELEEIGGAAYLGALVDGLPRVSSVADYAAVVREQARRRQAISVATRIQASAYEGEEPATGLIEAGVRELLRIADAPDVGVTQARAAVSDYLDALDAGTAGQALATGYTDLDELIGGVQLGHLTVVAARVSVGKTSWALGLADAMAARREGAALFSLEMSRHALAAQLLSWRSRVPAERVRRKRASEVEYARIAEAFAAFDDVPLYIVEGATTLSQVAAWARRLRDERGVRCVVIDYLQKLTGRRAQSREGEVAALSNGLKRLASDLDIAIVALAQLNRAPEQRSDKRPHLSDLRESGMIEADADLSILLFREEMYKATEKNEGVAECIVAKNRSGPTGVVRLYFNKYLAQFADLAQRL